MWDKIKKQLLVSLLFGMGIIIVLMVFADFRRFVGTVASFNALYIPVVLMLTFCNYIFRFMKWDYYLGQLAIKLPKRDSAVIFFSGLSMAVSPGKVGEFLKSFLLRQVNGTEVSKSAPVVIAERISDGIGLVILAAIGAVRFKHGVGVLVGVLGITLLGLLLVQSRPLMKRILAILGGFRPLARFTRSFAVFYESTYRLFTWKNLLVAVGLSVVSWAFECVALTFILAGFGIAFPLTASLFVLAFSQIAGAISMLPGGLGAAEGTITGLLIMLGISKDVAVAATLIIRFCTLWFGVTVGLVTLIISQRRLFARESC